jgi:hypothetical protein
MNKQEQIEALKSGLCVIKYTKKDGTVKVTFGTLSSKLLRPKWMDTMINEDAVADIEEAVRNTAKPESAAAMLRYYIGDEAPEKKEPHPTMINYYDLVAMNWRKFDSESDQLVVEKINEIEQDGKLQRVILEWE